VPGTVKVRSAARAQDKAQSMPAIMGDSGMVDDAQEGSCGSQAKSSQVLLLVGPRALPNGCLSPPSGQLQAIIVISTAAGASPAPGSPRGADAHLQPLLILQHREYWYTVPVHSGLAPFLVRGELSVIESPRRLWQASPAHLPL
jgi:hypothetical protein